MVYFKQLDSLRAIAVLLVILHHWSPPYLILSRLSLGPIGVTIFFVLSGFLITRILLQARKEAELGSEPVSAVLAPFYWRRALRIFPIYYLFLLVLYLFHDSTGTSIQQSIGYFLTYTSNFYFYSTQEWDGILSHLWTLAVEEQFYLIWPFVMLFTGRQYLLPAILFFTLIGIGSQYIFRDQELGTILTVACFDSFGLGGLLAWLFVYGTHYLDRAYKLIKGAAWAGAALLILFYVQPEWYLLPLRTIVSVLSLFFIATICKGGEPGGLFYLLLRNKVLQFIGRISYGIYLYHTLIPHYTRIFFLEKVNFLLSASFPKIAVMVLLQIEMFLVLLGLSWLSWLLIEKPILGFKKKFEYGSKANEQMEETVLGISGSNPILRA